MAAEADRQYELKMLKMMIKSLFAGAFFAGLLPLAAAGTVRNGSFEAFGGDGVPEFWKFTLSGGAPVAVAQPHRGRR